MAFDRETASTPSTSWRVDAARIVEELFREAPTDAWDLLLDLRQNLLYGSDWGRTLDIFLACREQLELDQYLPFFRLRRLLASSLKLEALSHTGSLEVRSLAELLRRRPRSLADLERTVRRELFEHSLEITACNVPLRLVERA